MGFEHSTWGCRVCGHRNPVGAKTCAHCARAELVGLSYQVERHERLRGDDKDFTLVVLRCIGYGVKDIQPAEWEFSFKVPHEELANWPLAKNVRLVAMG